MRGSCDEGEERNGGEGGEERGESMSMVRSFAPLVWMFQAEEVDDLLNVISSVDVT